MVIVTGKTRIWIAVFIACVLAFIGFGIVVHAQDEEPTIEEEYAVELNNVGDGRIVDTIRYSKEDYKVIKETADENKGFLTRRYSAVDFTGEIVDFKTKFDDENESVVISYNMPGYAYNSEGVWTIYGFPEEPDKSDDLIYTTTETSTINSEFTLFTDQLIETTSTIKLPEDAKDIEYDSNEQALKYETVPADEMLGFWRENRTLLLVIFGILLALSLGLLVFVITRKSRLAEDTAVASDLPAASSRIPAQQSQTAVPQPSPAAPAPDNTTGKTAVYCPVCGNKVPSGKHFCTHCGKSLD